ncbi:hypothetical protein [Rufibacter ruber]|uniref:hypothetical protein n=1 Tax=Rufibacter ruber TaxID=1783499 RepID=UPI000834F396|nr:hypothetical protein [Rufibacter ruber]
MKAKAPYSLVILLLFLLSCDTPSCISCIAQTPKMAIIEHQVICDEDIYFVEGFEAGMKDRYKDKGDTVTVLCDYFSIED